MKTTSRHISFEKLADLAENRLSEEKLAVSLRHGTACSHCAARVNDLEQLVNLMRTDSAEDAPRDARANAVALFGMRGSPTKTSIAQRLIAALSFDSARLSP